MIWPEPLRGRGDWLDAVLDDVQQRVLNDTPPTPDERAALFAARAQPDGNPGTVAFPSRLLSLVLDTDDGRGNRQKAPG